MWSPTSGLGIALLEGSFVLVYDRFMSSLSPTSLAVSDALTHYRQLRQLTRDELAYAPSPGWRTVSASSPSTT
jgi:hypothetical protein